MVWVLLGASNTSSGLGAIINAFPNLIVIILFLEGKTS
jgi:hypothetical protein